MLTELVPHSTQKVIFIRELQVIAVFDKMLIKAEHLLSGWLKHILLNPNKNLLFSHTHVTKLLPD